MDTSEKPPLKLTENTQHTLLETIKWIRYFIIITITGLFFAVIFNLIPKGNGMYLLVGNNLQQPSSPAAKVGAAITIIVIALIFYVYPLNSLNEFGKAIKQGHQTKEATDFETAFNYHKQTFKYLGILTIICLSLYVLLIIGFILILILKHSI